MRCPRSTWQSSDCILAGSAQGMPKLEYRSIRFEEEWVPEPEGGFFQVRVRGAWKGVAQPPLAVGSCLLKRRWFVM
eukprot:1308909-Pleurochrysis_carterae.AAC.1